MQKEIKGFENRYTIFDDGRIYSKRTNKFLTPHYNKNGYLTVELGDNEYKFKEYKLHRLLAIAFIPNPNNYKVVHHKDENKLNNSLDNLEWTTHKLNVQYSSGCRVKCLETGKIYLSQGDCAADMGLRKSHICSVLAGRLKSHGGYHFVKINKEKETEQCLTITD